MESPKRAPSLSITDLMSSSGNSFSQPQSPPLRDETTNTGTLCICGGPIMKHVKDHEWFDAAHGPMVIGKPNQLQRATEIKYFCRICNILYNGPSHLKA